MMSFYEIFTNFTVNGFKIESADFTIQLVIMLPFEDRFSFSNNFSVTFYFHMGH